MEQLKQYIYMDTIGIDSLLSQITSEFVEKSNIEITKQKCGTVKGNIGFSNLVKKFFNTDVSMSGEIDSTQRISKTVTQPYEAKIQQIINYIEDNQMLLKCKEEITLKYQDDKQNFIYFTMAFDTDFDYNNWFDAVALANKFGYISFYKGKTEYDLYRDDYEYHDSYYKKKKSDKTQIIMNMGISKMERFGGLTSHLAVLLRATKGLDINLGVFGNIYKLADGIYQIKPYAVWIG